MLISLFIFNLVKWDVKQDVCYSNKNFKQIELDSCIKLFPIKRITYTYINVQYVDND